MSRYILLILLNLPLIVAGIAGTLVDYKLNKTSRKKFILQVSIWVVILIAIVSVGFVNVYLTEANITKITSIDYFDIIQFTAIVYLLFIANRTRIKTDALEKRTNDLHRELSIELTKYRTKNPQSSLRTLLSDNQVCRSRPSPSEKVSMSSYSFAT